MKILHTRHKQDLMFSSTECSIPTRRLRCKWTPDLEKDLEDMSSILAAEINKEIDEEIISRLRIYADTKVDKSCIVPYKGYAPMESPHIIYAPYIPLMTCEEKTNPITGQSRTITITNL